MTKNHSKSRKSVLKFRDLRPRLTQIKQILSFCLLPSILCVSLVNAYPKPTPSTPPPQRLSQTNTPDSNRAAAEKAEAEAHQLGKQKAPYLTQVIPKWEEALKYWRLAKDHKKEALTLDHIAKSYWVRGEYPKALEYALKALPICQALGDKECEGAVTTSLSLIYDQMGEYQKAIDVTLQIPSLFPKDLGLPSIAYISVARIYRDKLGEPKKALEYYNKDLAFWREKGEIVKQAESLDTMALFYFTHGEINTSFDYIKQANTIDPEFKRNTGKYNLYDLIYVGLNSVSCADKIALIKKTPYIEKVENSSKQSGTPNSNADHTNLIEDLKQKAEKFHKQEIIRFEAESLSDLASTGYDRIGEHKKALAEYQKVLKLRQIMGDKPEEAKTLTDIANIFNKQGQKQEAINFLNQALEIQRQIKARPDEANTLVTIGDVYSSLGAYTESLRTYGQALSLWKNIGVRNKETYIPFAALPNPTQTKLQPLLVEHEIVNAPSASIIAVVRNETKNRNVAVKKLAVLADPVFSKDDNRLKPNVAHGEQNRGKNSNSTDLNALALKHSSCDSNLSFPRLEGTLTEAKNILSLVPESSRKSAFDFAANRTTVTNPEMSQYQIVHFATHGMFDTNNPKCSSIVLSLVDSKGNAEDGFLQLQDIFNLNLPAELVVLSACETGLGEQVKGEGLVGLTRGFMYAGSPRVAVSLWSVDDNGTAELMTKFYTKMLKDNLRPVAALRAAQLEMWQSPNPKYSRTDVWAAFTLQGEWR